MLFSANIGFLYTDLPLPDRIRAAKRAGFDAVECHFPYDVPVAEMRAALDETALPPCLIGRRRRRRRCGRRWSMARPWGRPMCM